MARRIVPPTGFYDPALDAQVRAASAGYLDLQQDAELAGSRAAQDYGFGLEDLTTNRDRSWADLTTQRDRALQDYDTDVASLNRSYTQLQRRQAEGAAQSGVLSGGLALKAAAIRNENKGIEQNVLDTNRTRMLQDIWTQGQRVGQDFNTQSGRLAVDYGRGVADRTTALTRAGRENTQFGLDIDEQRLYQAAAAGWIPPAQGGGGRGGSGGDGQLVGRYRPGGVGPGMLSGPMAGRFNGGNVGGGADLGAFGGGGVMNIQDLLRRLRG